MVGPRGRSISSLGRIPTAQPHRPVQGEPTRASVSNRGLTVNDRLRRIPADGQPRGALAGKAGVVARGKRCDAAAGLPLLGDWNVPAR